MNVKRSLLVTIVALVTASYIIFNNSYALAREVGWTYVTPPRQCTTRTSGPWWNRTEHVDCRNNPRWTENDKEVIRESMRYFNERTQSSDVQDCAWDKTQYYRGENQETAISDTSAMAASPFPHINMTGYYDYDATTRGRAQLIRRANSIHDVFSGGPFDIELNLIAIREQLSNDGVDETAKNFAGVIAHEIMHQLGHSHPTTGDYENDYQQGHFVVVYGDCIYSNGEDARGPFSGLSLTDQRRYNWPTPD